MRSHVIERIMCDFAFDFATVTEKFGAMADDVIAEARQFARTNQDGLCEVTDKGFVLTETGKPLARTMASIFDAYLGNGKGRHSIAV